MVRPRIIPTGVLTGPRGAAGANGLNGVDSAIYGSGPPENVVTATVGKSYVDTAKTRGARRWVKESGSGNTGWVAVEGSTGWRDMTGSLSSVWRSTTTAPYGATRALLVRDGDRCTLVVFLYLAVSGAGGPRSADQGLFGLSAGFTPHYFTPLGAVRVAGGVGLAHVQGDGTTIQISAPHATGNWSADDILMGEISWRTDDPWPASLPGVAV